MKDGLSSDVLAAAAGYLVRVESFLGADVLALEVPLADGVFKVDSTQAVIESASLAVPSHDGVRSWLPGTDARHPLGRFGQELMLTAVMWAGSEYAETPLGRVRIDDWDEDDDEVAVTASGVLARVADARLTTATVPRKDGTLASELRRLMVGGVPVAIDAALVDRDCPSSFTWDEDRLAAVYDIADVWPAVVVPDGLGGVLIIPEPDTDGTAVFAFTDGVDGTVAHAPRADTRANVYNHVVARAQTEGEDAPLVQGEAMVTSGPYAVDGPYGDVPRFYSSPALKTEAQCISAAESLLAKSLRPSRTITVTAAVDPRVELYDLVTVTWGDVEYTGLIIGYELPLVLGDMALTVAISSERIIVDGAA